MNYMDALRRIHAAIRPHFYVEIGCLAGASLELADCDRLGIDPDPKITGGLTRPTRIYKQTSDAFFGHPDVGAIFGRPPDLAFIDGMHLAEFALRDFVNLEAHAAPHSVIVIDDVVPGDILWAARERQSQAWTGDVYRLIPILRKYRPDLDIRVFDASIQSFDKGLAVIRGLDPQSSVLRDALPQIEAEIAAGAFEARTIAEIRGMLDVSPAETFDAYVRTIPPAPRSSGGALADRYLELAKASLLNEIRLEDEVRIFYLRECLEGKAEYDPAALLDIRAAFPDRFADFAAARQRGQAFGRDLANLGFAETMMGRKRMDNLHDCLDIVRRRAIPGDVVECGIWRGGGCIFMAAYLAAHGMNDRKVIAADSFRGLPKPSLEQDNKLDLSRDRFPQLAISRETVARNFAAYGLLSEQVVFLEGWFKDTLRDAPTRRIALLRLDGDLYESTMDILTALYDRVAPGAPVIVDDYGAVSACRKALEDFFEARGEAVPELLRIDWTGVYFLKPETG